MRKLNTTQRRRRRVERLEALHRYEPTFDEALVLFDDIVQVASLPNSDWRMLDPLIDVQDRRTVGSAAIDIDACGDSIVIDRPFEEPSSRSLIAPLCEIEIDRVAVATNRARQTATARWHRDAGSVHSHGTY